MASSTVPLRQSRPLRKSPPPLPSPLLTSSSCSSGLLNAGYEVSRSHASAGSIKTNAPRHVVYDVIRAWIKDHPVEMKNIKTGSPALKLLSKENPCVLVSSVSLLGEY